MIVKIGDVVRVWKFVLDRGYSATGTVDKIQEDNLGRQLVYVAGDWWVNENTLTNECNIVRGE